MKKIEFAELLRMGANEKQLETYSNSDPLAIYETANGEYKMIGIIEQDNMTAHDVLDILDALSNDE